MRFRKKPVVIEAVQFTDEDSGYKIVKWAREYGVIISSGIGLNGIVDELCIPTLEGDHKANYFDWIIKGVKNEFYPCKPDIFETTYEPVTGKLEIEEILKDALEK